MLNADDQRVGRWRRGPAPRSCWSARRRTRPCGPTDVELDERGRAGVHAASTAGGPRRRCRLGIAGRHQVGNTLLAAAVARALGMPLADAGPALGELRLVSTRRMDVFDRADGVTVIDDSYNANPASTAAALRALAAIGPGRRRIAVLGYLAELGEHERDGHEEVGRLAAELGVDRLVVVGAGGRADPRRRGRRWRIGEESRCW